MIVAEKRNYTSHVHIHWRNNGEKELMELGGETDGDACWIVYCVLDISGAFQGPETQRISGWLSKWRRGGLWEKNIDENEK